MIFDTRIHFVHGQAHPYPIWQAPGHGSLSDMVLYHSRLWSSPNRQGVEEAIELFQPHLPFAPTLGLLPSCWRIQPERCHRALVRYKQNCAFTRFMLGPIIHTLPR